MSVLIYLENEKNSLKKSTLEAIAYGYALANGSEVTGVASADVDNAVLEKAGAYGMQKVMKATNVNYFTAESHSAMMYEAAQKCGAKIIIIPASFSGKGLAPRVAVKMKAAYVDSAIALPDTTNGFVVRTGAFSGKAFADIQMMSDIKIISLAPNVFSVKENPVSCTIEEFTLTENDLMKRVQVKETIKAEGKISLPEAELVVSAGRGMKGPENWGMIEELAQLLGAATACSKPVSDADWRPHSEHVGQTGIAISPNLYIAIGISGAIQHLAGVSSSKVIVVINKDSEAPFFKAADYGIVGDAFEVVPKLIEAVKKFKGINA